MLTNSLRRDDVIPFNGNLVRSQLKVVVVPLIGTLPSTQDQMRRATGRRGLLSSAAKRPPISTLPWRCLLPMA